MKPNLLSDLYKTLAIGIMLMGLLLATYQYHFVRRYSRRISPTVLWLQILMILVGIYWAGIFFLGAFSIEVGWIAVDAGILATLSICAALAKARQYHP